MGVIMPGPGASDDDLRIERMADEWSTNSQRIAVLEAEHKHTIQKLEDVGKRTEAIQVQVKEMHDLLMQAKGARWAIIGVAGLAGFLSGKLAALAAVFGVKVP